MQIMQISHAAQLSWARVIGRPIGVVGEIKLKNPTKKTKRRTTTKLANLLSNRCEPNYKDNYKRTSIPQMELVLHTVPRWITSHRLCSKKATPVSMKAVELIVQFVSRQ